MMAGAGFIVGIFGLVFYLFILLLPIALLVALQVWLCRKSAKLGLILPGLSLALSLLMVFSMGAFATMHGGGIEGGANQVVPAPEGSYIEAPDQEDAPRGETEKTEFNPRTLLMIGAVFLVTNIPTAVFGGIWLHYKGRRDTLEALKRMRIEDLE